MNLSMWSSAKNPGDRRNLLIPFKQRDFLFFCIDFYFAIG